MHVPLRIVLAVVWLLLAVAALAGSGVGLMLITVALPALAIAAFAAVAGHARWAFVPNRGTAAVLAVTAFALIVAGGAALRTPTARPLAATPSTTTAPTTTMQLPITITTTTATAAVVTTTTTVSAPAPAPVRSTTKAAKVTTTTPLRPTTTTQPPAPNPIAPLPARAGCDPSYPTLCLLSIGPTLRCDQIPQKRFSVRGVDRHGFDGNHDGIGCQ